MRAFAHDVAARSWSALRPLRNRLFRPRLRWDPHAPVVILSPHPDDAVLDCWSVLSSSAEVEVVNVFGSLPPASGPTYFERVSGARDSREHLRRRLEEDRDALGLVGRSPVNLGCADLSHRRGRPEPTFHRIDRALTARVPAASRVYAPAALGTPHADHQLVRAYALRVAAAGVPVRLFADLPYCAVYGWPAWVTGALPDPNLDVDAYWRASLNGAAGACAPARADVVRLSDAAAARKLTAMRTYRSEFAALDRGPIRQLSNPAIHRFEVFWPVAVHGAAP